MEQAMLKRSPATEKKNNVSCEIQEFLEGNESRY